MINAVKRRDRKELAQKRLCELRDKGFRYVMTNDEGATWIGSQSDGIEIENLLGIEFVGNVVVV